MAAGCVRKNKFMLWKLAQYTHQSDQVVQRSTGWRIMVSTLVAHQQRL